MYIPRELFHGRTQLRIKLIQNEIIDQNLK